MKQNILIFFDFMNKLFVRDRSMIYVMAIRELKTRYVGSLFGLFWTVFEPMVQLALYGMVFGLFMGAKSNQTYGTDSFFLYLMCGLVPWQFFSQTINRSTGSVRVKSNLIKKAVGFPSEIIPIVTVIMGIINHLVAVSLMLIILVIFTGTLSPYTPLILVYTLLISIFAVGIGWIVSSLNVYLRDIQQIMGLLMLSWFFFTPIFWASDRFPSQIMRILEYNPMFVVVDGYRYLLLAGRIPPLSNLAYLAVISFVTFGVGGIFFRKLKPGFAEVL